MRNKRLLLALAIGFVLGTLWLIAVRFAAYKGDNVHHHANFAVYVDGQREEFDGFMFYEEVQSCGSDEANNPRTRVHLHDMVNHVAHVHDSAATWGHLFANLGYTLGNDVIKTEDGVFTESGSKKMTFILNGRETEAVANQTIRSEDVLLINYGDEDKAALQQRYDDITRDAADYNKRNDPSACTGSKPATFTERLKEAIGF